MKTTNSKAKEDGCDSSHQEETRKQKYIAFHDDSPCKAKLNPDGFCPVCKHYPDMQSIVLKKVQQSQESDFNMLTGGHKEW
jgi:hypothetical protein